MCWQVWGKLDWFPAVCKYWKSRYLNCCSYYSKMAPKEKRWHVTKISIWFPKIVLSLMRHTLFMFPKDIFLCFFKKNSVIKMTFFKHLCGSSCLLWASLRALTDILHLNDLGFLLTTIHVSFYLKHFALYSPYYNSTSLCNLFTPPSCFLYDSASGSLKNSHLIRAYINSLRFYQ